MFDALENTSLALWVGESLWAYPGLLSVHIIGLAIVVGLFTMRDLSLLGMFAAIDSKVFLGFNKIAVIGFVINAVSGFMLFSSQASHFIQSTPFLIKIAAITFGMTLAWVLHSRLSRGSYNKVTSGTKIIAGLSILSWLSAIAAGRLIAYL
jgi:hypothetical protein